MSIGDEHDPRIQLVVGWVEDHEEEYLELSDYTVIDGSDVLAVVENLLERNDFLSKELLDVLYDYLAYEPDAELVDIWDIIEDCEGNQVVFGSSQLVTLRMSYLESSELLEQAEDDEDDFFFKH